ncbi:MAG: fibronectin type III domain-containing protein [Lachnospiraceae bacterium]|nr:fibronectin type III domain-containing protein [Lachnospiraceae bacterium]
MKILQKTKAGGWLLFALLFMCILMADVRTVYAADNPVTVSSCKLNSSGKKLTVKAKVKQKTKEMGSKLYLLALDSHTSETGQKSIKPIKKVKAKKGTVTFKVKYDSSMLYQKFVVACKSGKKYKIISDAKYITNPEVLATYTGKGPQVTSKKGLQVEELSDSLEIGTKHAVINWTLNSLLNNDAVNKMEYVYKGKTYYIDADQIQRNDELIQAYNKAGVRVTIILLLPKDNNSTGTQAMQFGGYPSTKYSSVKTSSKAGAQTFEAIMTYLAGHYGTEENLVTGWILGNEINAPYVWNYGGNKKLSTYIKNYARSFRICYNAVKSVNKNANVYVSLDNNWNRDFDSGNRYFSSKAVLDSFYKQMKAQGNIVFRIAYHAYPQGMGDPIFWDDSLATNSTNSQIINFKNLTVLTNYVKKNFGKKYKIMLSEQSFNTSRGEVMQAAAYAYAYYMSEGNDMIEAFIYGREFDHPEELKEGYYWGLCDQWHVKRLIWSVYQYIDTADSFKFTDPLLKHTGLSKWKKIKGFKKSKYTNMPSIRKKGIITDVTSLSTTSAMLTWEKLNTGDGYEIYRDGTLIAQIAGNSTVTYKDTGLTPGTTYQYQVRMYKEAPVKKNAEERTRIYGEISDPLAHTVATGQVEINTEKCAVSGNEITIKWKKQEDASGYEVLRSTEENGTYAPIAVVEAGKGTYKDQNTISGTTYYYKVRSFITINGVNYYGKESESYSALALILLTVTEKNGEVTFNWSKWLSADKYRVYCKADDEESYTRIKTITAQNYSCKQYKNAAGTKVGFDSGKTYSFRVRADFGDGTYSKYSNVVSITIGPITEDGGGNEGGNTGGETGGTGDGGNTGGEVSGNPDGEVSGNN